MKSLISEMKLKVITLLVGLLLSSLSASAQYWVVKGTVADSTENLPLQSATVVLTKLADSTKRAFSTTELGEFRITGIVNGNYQLQVSFVGFKPFKQSITVQDASVDLGRISLAMDATALDDVTVEGLADRVQQNGDTTEYNAAGFKVNPDATAESLIEKLPGVVIQNGQVQAQGEAVRRVLVDGREFFGDDPNAALRNLPAEIIERIQVYDQASDQAQFTGFMDGETSKTLNIITRASMRNGEFGNIYAGGGTDETYNVGGSINLFREKSRTTILGQMNNINIQNFSTSDLLGITAGGGRRAGMRGGGGGGRGAGGGGFGGGGAAGGGAFMNGGNASNFLVGQQGGISETKALGINYSYQDNGPLKFSGSYFFNQSDNNSDESIFRQYTLDRNEGQTYEEQSFSPSRNINHRFSGELEYTINDKNSIIMRPRFTFQDNSGSGIVDGNTMLNGSLLNTAYTQNTSYLEAFSFSNNLLFRHAFEKRGRTFSVNLNTALNENSGDSYLLSENIFYTGNTTDIMLNQFGDQDVKGLSLSTNATYTEPLTDKSQLMLSYNYGYQYNDSGREQFDFNEGLGEYSDLNTLLSNTFENDYITHNTSIGYNLRGEKGTLTLRGAYQWAILDNDQTFPFEDNVDRNFANFIPSVVYRYRMENGKSINFTYRTNTDAPSVNQLQSVINNTDPLNISAGNPQLDQSYQHSATIRFNKVNRETNNVFFTLLSGSFSDNRIGTSSYLAGNAGMTVDGIDLQPGARYSKPVNLEGYWNLRSFISYGMPLSAIKSNLNFTGTLAYSQSPEMVNGETNYAKTPSTGLGVVLSSNISENLDFTLSSNSSFNSVSNTLEGQTDTNYFNQSTRLRLNWIFGQG
ncbi:MAG: TonB-dependent receptor, partial [Cytophagia bacterium]|nr:TonB-dependent receptor [Cytophagia bacterium]